MAKTTRRRRQAKDDQPRNYGKKNPNHPTVLNGRIWRCTDPECDGEKTYTLQGIKMHNFKMHGRSWNSTVRIDGHPMPETIMVRGQNILDPATLTEMQANKKARHNAATGKVAHAASINYCPCCGTSLQAFQAAADILAHG